MAYSYNTSYSGGRDQDGGSKPAWGKKKSARPYLKKAFIKNRAGGVAQGKGPEFKPQYCQKKKIIVSRI
jgi:hypothetical protein